MSKNALNELLTVSSEKFNIMVKNMPNSEKPEILRFLNTRKSLLENLSWASLHSLLMFSQEQNGFYQTLRILEILLKTSFCFATGEHGSDSQLKHMILEFWHHMKQYRDAKENL